jgi:hypothetical protein
MLVLPGRKRKKGKFRHKISASAGNNGKKEN